MNVQKHTHVCGKNKKNIEIFAEKLKKISYLLLILIKIW